MSKEFLQDDGQLRVFIVPVDILDVPNLTSSEKLVYIVLRSYVNPTDPTAFPAYGTIAKKASLSRRRVIDIIKSLEEKGLIRKEVRLSVTPDRKIKNTSNLYTIVAPKVHKVDRGEMISPPLVKSFHPPSEIISPYHNHLKEPSLNMIDCMSQSVEINDVKENLINLSEVENEIMDALHTHVPKQCYAENLPLGQAYIAEIYLMLLKQFQHRLSAEIVRMAAERYFDRACDVLPDGSIVNKFEINNPVGLFHDCYKEAIKLYKAQHKPS